MSHVFRKVLELYLFYSLLLEKGIDFWYLVVYHVNMKQVFYSQEHIDHMAKQGFDINDILLMDKDFLAKFGIDIDDMITGPQKKYENKMTMAGQLGDKKLNHFWNKDNLSKFWGIADMDKDYPHEKLHEEKHGNTKFLLAKGSELVSFRPADGYDENGVYEGPHGLKRRCRYQYVSDFFPSEPTSVLDLTWMNPKDTFRLKDSVQYRNVKNIIVNINNLWGSFLPPRVDENSKLNFLIKNTKGTDYNRACNEIDGFFTLHCISNLDRGAKDWSVVLDGFDAKTTNTLTDFLSNRMGITVSKYKQLNIEVNPQAIKIAKTAEDDLTK